jgi:cytochrome P450
LLEGIAGVLDDAQRLGIARSLLEFQAYFQERIEERRLEPRDDLLSELVHAEVEGEGRLDLEELFPIIVQIVIAGHETSTNFIANSIVIMLETPGMVEKLRDDRTLIPPFLEECLRYDPPLHSTLRRAAQDMTFAGAQIGRDDVVVPFWGAAGRDPAVFPDPDTFDATRGNVRRHLAFGHGIHFCIGAELARLEGRIAVEMLLDRFDAIELDEADSELEPRGGHAHYGYPRVILRVAPSARDEQEGP